MTISASNALKTEATLLSIAFIFVALRCYVQIFKLRAFGAPDILIVFAWICYMVNVILDFTLHHHGWWDSRIQYRTDGTLPDFNSIFPDHNALVMGLKLQYATYNFYFCELYAIKFAFLYLYLRLFPPEMVKLRRTLYFTIILCTVGIFSTVLLNFLYCIPVSSNWTIDPKKRCLSWANVNLYIYAGGMNIITDLIVYALPFFLIPKMYRTASRSKIASAFAVFCFGTISMACTIVRLLIVGKATDTAKVTAWYTAEQASAIICACLPPLKWLFTRSVINFRESLNWTDWSGVWHFSTFRSARSSRQSRSSRLEGSGGTKGSDGATDKTGSSGARTAMTTGTFDDHGIDLERHGFALAPPRNPSRTSGIVGQSDGEATGVVTAIPTKPVERKASPKSWKDKLKGKLTHSLSRPSSLTKSPNATFGSRSTAPSTRHSTFGSTTRESKLASTSLEPLTQHDADSCLSAFSTRGGNHGTGTPTAGSGIDYMTGGNNTRASAIDDESVKSRNRQGSGAADPEAVDSQAEERRRKGKVRISAVVESQSIKSCRTGSSHGKDGGDNVRGSPVTATRSISTMPSVESFAASFTFGRPA